MITLTVQNLLLIGGWLVTIIIFVVATKSDIKSVKGDISMIKSVIFEKGGKLGVVDGNTCREHRRNISLDMDHSEATSRKIIQNMEVINGNILSIMVHLKMDMPDGKITPISLQRTHRTERTSEGTG